MKQEIRTAADKLLHKTEEGFHDDQYLTYEINHSMGRLQAKVKEVETEMDQALSGWQRKVDRAVEMLKTSEVSITMEQDEKDAEKDKKDEE